MLSFEWDPAKARANERKHRVSFEVAQSVFYDEFARQYYDPEGSEAEDWFLLLGMSNTARILLVCHYERAEGDVIRIISARKATRNERVFYVGPNK